MKHTQVRNGWWSGEGSEVVRPDHHLLASDVDIATEALARIGRSLGRLDPVAGTLDRAVIAAMEAVTDIRRHLDRAYVAAGRDAARSPYIRRDLRPSTETKAAARRARADAQEAERLAQAKRDALHAERGHAGWAARGGA